jgi:hypothetical protein
MTKIKKDGLSIGDWLLIQNTTEELDIISIVMGVEKKDLLIKSVEDYLACRTYTDNVLKSIMGTKPDNHFEINGEPYIVLETYRDMNVSDWLDVESLIKTEKGFNLSYKLFILLSRKNVKGFYKASVSAEEYDYREKEWLNLPVEYLLQTNSFFLQKLIILEKIGQSYTLLQNLLTNQNQQTNITNNLRQGLKNYQTNMDSRGFYGKLHNNLLKSLTNLNLWLSRKHLFLLVCLSKRKSLLKSIQNNKS